jgi:hypothetical protein
LAELQIEQIESAITEQEIRDLLQTLPGEIDEQYKSYIETLGAQRQGRLALKALMWAYGCCKPISVEELLQSLSVHDGDGDLDPTGMTTIGTILNISGGLLTFEKESNTVRLAHETLQEFLNQVHHQILPGCHLMISKTIATYLNFASLNIPLDTFSSNNSIDLAALQRSHKLSAMLCFIGTTISAVLGDKDSRLALIW